MAQLPPNSAIFSPSVARAAASAAKDWSFIDNWLASKYQGRTPPAFERNADTLRSLLALANANQSADEERKLVARVDQAALRELQAHDKSDTARQSAQRGDNSTSSEHLREGMLEAIEAGLSREAKIALDNMTSAAVNLNIAFSEPEQLGRDMAALQTGIFDTEQTHARVAVLQRYIGTELVAINALLDDVQSAQYRPASDLAKQNLDAQRKIKTMDAKLVDLQEKTGALSISIGMPNPTLEQVQKNEQIYLGLLGRRDGLDGQVKAFQGLPPDTDQAREELENLRAKLRQVTQRRDVVFEELVERETPRKPRR